MSTDGVATKAEQLHDRLNDPQVADALNRLLDRLDVITFGVESMEGFISRGEVIADSVASTVNDMKDLRNEKTTELIQKAPQLFETGTRLTEAAAAIDVDELNRSKVLARLTEPKTLDTLNQLLDRLPLASFLLDSVEGFIGRGETIADNLADAVGELNLGENGIDPDQLASLMKSLPKLKEAGEKLLDSDLMGDGLPTVIGAGVSMVESGMLDKDVVSVLGDLGKKSAQTYREVAEQPVEPIGGLWATLKATKDPDVQKSVGFFFAFAKAFAKHLK
jgi:hypothetical protein